MNYKTSKLRDAVLLALLAGGFSSAAMAQTANPQSAATTQDSSKQLDQIVVTGTRIKSQTETASSPVTEVSGEQFKLTGATRAEDLVNAQPQMSPVFDSFQNNGARGYAAMDLRGLGATRTLTLVNGNRLAPGASFAADVSILPTSIIKRVDLLTGGASAVYGSDAIAGVVNFVLDDQFEGVSLTVGGAGYQHNNRNKYLQGLMDKRSFPYPTGNSGLDGFSRNIDLAIGSSFADGQGHAMAWMTWRKNDALYQSQRDYSACALNGTGTACGGSDTNAAGNFYIYQKGADGFGEPARRNADGSWASGYGAPYNYAPINYFQRPDKRYTFGATANYKINQHFEPYVEMMYANKRDSTQIAPSGAFFVTVDMDCKNPLLGNLCSTFNVPDPTKPVSIQVAKRNTEGGPRYSAIDNSQYRILGGLRGNIMGAWDYNVSYLYGRNIRQGVGSNDFIKTRIQSALTGCTSAQYGTFPGCQLYNVWVPGGVTPAAAKALAGTSFSSTTTSLSVFNGYISGNFGWGLPWANKAPISMVAGYEHRVEKYGYVADSISQQNGFAGAGGASPPLFGSISVSELFTEAAVPLFSSEGFLKNLGMELGYRTSRYTNSKEGGVSTHFNANTYKIGFNADMGMLRLRGGFNKAIRAPNLDELYSVQSVGLWSGTDGCAGATPQYTADQCAKTGVTAAQYGRVPTNAASQYNGMFGGNYNLQPEQAKTWTFGVVVLPIKNMRLNVDYYDIKLSSAIDSFGAQNSLDICATTGDPTMCSKIKRGPGGTLTKNDLAYVIDVSDNVGYKRFRGIDVGAAYNWKMWGGNMYASFNGSYYLERLNSIPGTSISYRCEGHLTPGACNTPQWRHIASLGWSGPVGLNLRWRRMGSVSYVDKKGNPLAGTKNSDVLISPKGGVGAYDYLDLSASYDWRAARITLGVNNIFDKEPPMVGGGLNPSNANALGGYDPVGRMIFSNITFNF